MFQKSRQAALALLSVLIAPVSLVAEQVIFSEIQYNPEAGKPEFLEITNNTSTPFDIAQWQMTDGVDYTFPEFSEASPRDAFLAAWETILLTGATEADLRAAYPNIPADVRVFGPWTGQLNNAGERLTLSDKNGVARTTVRYDNSGKWSAAPQGTGHTLTVVDPNRVVDDYRNWRASAARGGTPGTKEEASGDSIPLDSGAAGERKAITYVAFGTEWKVEDSNTDLGTDWTKPDYDDSAWRSAPALLGFESSALPDPGLQSPLARDSAGGLVTYYFRKEFDFSLGVEGSEIIIDQIIDDGAVYYLNGMEIGRSGMPAGPITHTTVSADGVSNAELVPEVVRIDGTGVLQQGRNVLAVSLHNEKAGSSDVVFGAQLHIAADSPSLVINEIYPAGPGEGFIEFYNPLDTAISLEGYFLSNSAENLKKNAIGPGIEVPASGLMSVGYTELGFSAGETVKVFFTDPGGTTVLDEVDANVPVGFSWGRKPSGGSKTFLLAGQSRNGPNLGASDLTDLLSVSEIHFTDNGEIDWVEVGNRSTTPVNLDGLFVASNSDFSDRVALNGPLGPKGVRSVDAAFKGEGNTRFVYLTTASNDIISAARISAPSAAASIQEYPIGANEYYLLDTTSRDEPTAAMEQDIVINEIMYDLPSDHRSGEYVELFNKGDSPVDVSDWRFTEGIQFEFPNGTTIAPGGYLVVSADTRWFNSVYSGINVLGNFEGQLRDGGELLRLEDANGNLVDEVHYFPEGDWPELADGDGSSLELRHPDMDNSKGAAWADSDESGKAEKNLFHDHRRIRTHSHQ